MMLYQFFETDICEECHRLQLHCPKDCKIHLSTARINELVSGRKTELHFIFVNLTPLPALPSLTANTNDIMLIQVLMYASPCFNEGDAMYLDTFQ